MSNLTPQEHEHNADVEEAARWLAEQQPRPHPVVSVIRTRFNLTAVEACEACAMADRYRLYRVAHG